MKKLIKILSILAFTSLIMTGCGSSGCSGDDCDTANIASDSGEGTDDGSLNLDGGSSDGTSATTDVSNLSDATGTDGTLDETTENADLNDTTEDENLSDTAEDEASTTVISTPVEGECEGYLPC